MLYKRSILLILHNLPYSQEDKVIPIAQHIRKTTIGNYYQVLLPLPWHLTQTPIFLGKMSNIQTRFESFLLYWDHSLERKSDNWGENPVARAWHWLDKYTLCKALARPALLETQRPPLRGHGMWRGVCMFPAAYPSHHYSCQPTITVIQYMDLLMSAWQQRAAKVRRQLILDWNKFIESVWQDPKENTHFSCCDGKTWKLPLIQFVILW